MAETGEKIVHGGINYAEFERLGIDPATVIDFSVNGNPFGPSPRVREALQSVDIARYPDRHCLALRRAILAHELPETVGIESVLCGSGTAELIWAIARAFLAPGAKAAILGPTFGEYGAACRAARATVVEHRTQPGCLGFVPDVNEIADWLRHERPALVWLCNPNNPTGHWLDETHLRHIAAACASIGAPLVTDEAYWHFLFPPEPFSAVRLIGEAGMPEMIVARSLTKDFALAGLRLGYLVAAPEAIARIAAQLPSWNVSAAAQAAGVAALGDRDHLTRTLTALAAERDAFFDALAGLALPVVPSRTHYTLVDVGSAAKCRQRLLARGILVRDCASFGLPQFIRIATRPRKDWQEFIAAFAGIPGMNAAN